MFDVLKLEKDILKDTRFENFLEVDEEIFAAIMKLSEIFTKQLNVKPAIVYSSIIKHGLLMVAADHAMTIFNNFGAQSHRNSLRELVFKGMEHAYDASFEKMMQNLTDVTNDNI